MDTLKCSKCGEPHSRRGQRYCGACHAAYMRAHRPKYRELTDVQRAKGIVRSYANVYKRRGYLRRRPCADCGSGNAQMHHDDYDQALAVVWVCRRCHLRRHATRET